MNRQRYTTCHYHLLLSIAIISGILGTVVPLGLRPKIRLGEAVVATNGLKRNAVPMQGILIKYNVNRPKRGM